MARRHPTAPPGDGADDERKEQPAWTVLDQHGVRGASLVAGRQGQVTGRVVEVVRNAFEDRVPGR